MCIIINRFADMLPAMYFWRPQWFGESAFSQIWIQSAARNRYYIIGDSYLAHNNQNLYVSLVGMTLTLFVYNVDVITVYQDGRDEVGMEWQAQYCYYLAENNWIVCVGMLRNAQYLVISRHT